MVNHALYIYIAHTPHAYFWCLSLLNAPPPTHAIHTHHTTHTINTYTPNTVHTHIHTLHKSKILKLSPICNYYICANPRFRRRHKIICKILSLSQKKLTKNFGISSTWENFAISHFINAFIYELTVSSQTPLKEHLNNTQHISSSWK